MEGPDTLTGRVRPCLVAATDRLQYHQIQKGASMEDLSAPMVSVPSVEDMSDEILMKHMEARHGESLALKFRDEPDRAKRGLPRRLHNPETWRIYHDKLHELYDGRETGPYRHVHKEPNGA